MQYLLTLFKFLSVTSLITITSSRQQLQTPGLFVLLSVKLLSPEPIICFDCQGSELAQSSVAMLRGKTGLPLSCGPEGCWDGEPKPCG